MRKVIELALRYRLILALLGAGVLAAGYYNYRNLPVEAFPDVSPNLVQVFTTTHGLAPEEVEKYVTYPIEVTMNGLPKLKLIRSVSNFGLSVVNIYFEDDTDIYFARQLVNERLREAKEKIPPGFGEPQLGPISTAMGLILFYYLTDETGSRSLTEMRTIQDWVVKPYLQTVPGVTEVLGIGGHEKQYHVVVRPDALLRYKVTINELVQVIRANNLNVGAQFIEKNAEEYFVRSVGLTSTAEDIRRIVVKSVQGVPVYLAQLARVKVGGAVRRGLHTRAGKTELVSGMVIKLYGTNASKVIRRVEKKITEISRILPKGVKLVPYYEQKTLVESCVKTVNDALLQGIAFVVVILVVFLGSIRPSIVVVFSIPFSVLFATFWMKVLGMTANLMSLGGLAIAIGMMVDGTIVVVENIDRQLRNGAPPVSRLRVVGKAAAQVVRPIFFAILIIITVFLPLFTLQGVEGKTFRPLAYTVALAMFGSMVFAIFLAPVLSYLLMQGRKSGTTTRASWSDSVIRWLTRGYRPAVSYFVRRRFAAVAVASVLVFLGVLAFLRLGSEFTPRLSEGTMILRLTMAPSISLTEAKRVTMIVERRLMRIPEVKDVVTRIGRGEVGAHTDPVNSAEILLLLKPRKNWRSARTQDELERVIRKELGPIPGVLTSFTQPIETTVDELLEGVRAELAVKIFGEDLVVLRKMAVAAAAVIREIPGAADVQVDQVSGTPQLLIRLDREAIARYGINVADAQQVIRTAVGGEVAGQVFEGVRRFDILVRFAPEFRNTREAIGNILVHAPDGTTVPLKQLASIKELVGPRQITRENNKRFITIQCNVTGRDIGGFVEEARKAIAEKVRLPPGYLVTWGGQFKLQQHANRRLAVVVPITLAVVLTLLYVSFNSIKNALLILFNIPLALVGGAVGLYLSGQNLSVPASVGFIALFGIALENGVVLVTYLNELVRKGLPLDEASIKGACLRLRPVLMTALTTALGLIPLLISRGTGSEVQRPLATVVIGGLISSTLLTLLVVPALYGWFAPARKGSGSSRQSGGA